MTSLSSKMLAMINQLREQRKKHVDYPKPLLNAHSNTSLLLFETGD